MLLITSIVQKSKLVSCWNHNSNTFGWPPCSKGNRFQKRTSPLYCLLPLDYRGERKGTLISVQETGQGTRQWITALFCSQKQKIRLTKLEANDCELICHCPISSFSFNFSLHCPVNSLCHICSFMYNASPTPNHCILHFNYFQLF